MIPFPSTSRVLHSWKVGSYTQVSNLVTEITSSYRAGSHVSGKLAALHCPRVVSYLSGFFPSAT